MQQSAIASGDKIGRFVIIEQLGAGGSGRVFSAYDPRLDRKIALKTIAASSQNDALRIAREARALAQLNHPNVLHVHEIDHDRDLHFIVTELVDGSDLRKWLKQEHGWRDIVSVFLHAAQGLLAAHDIGLIHRDLKPANILIGKDGQVQVADFGLARSHNDNQTEPTETANKDLLTAHLTQTGIYSGTPAYMAPEQWQDGHADALSDQFSFACALYEALYRELPFDGETPAARLKAIQNGPQEPLHHHGVPQSIRKILCKALAYAPQDRYADMSALVAELNRALAFRRRVWSVTAAVLVLGLFSSVFLLRNTPQLCQIPGAARAAWSSDIQQQIQQAFVDRSPEVLPAVFSQIFSRVDDKLGGWEKAYLDSCEATHVYGRQSETVMDHQMLCLHQQEQQLIALSDIFRAPNDSIINSAARAVDAVPIAQSCLDIEQLLYRTPLPEDPQQAAMIEQQKGEMAKIQALFDTGQPQQALDGSLAVQDAVFSHEYHPIQSEYLLQQGMLQSRLDQFEQAAASFQRSQFLGLMSGAFDSALQAVAEWLWQEVYLQVKSGPMVEEKMQESATLATLAATGDKARSAHFRTLGSIQQNQGNLEQAIANQKKAMAYARKGYGVPSFKFAASAFNLGNAQRLNGQMQDAKASYAQAARAFEQSVGDSHPVAGMVVSTLGSFLLEQGYFEEAIDELKRALALSKKHYGEVNSQHAVIYQNMGVAYLANDDFQNALNHYQLALKNLDQVGESAWGDDIYVGLAESYIGLGQPKNALKELDNAQTILANKPASYVHANRYFLLACAQHQSGESLDQVFANLDKAQAAIQDGFEKHLVDNLTNRIQRLRTALQADPNNSNIDY